MLTGIYSDRYGVKQFILAGLVILTVAGFLSAVTTSYALMIVWRILIGIGATAIFIPGLATAMFLLPPQRVN
ncbi:MAG: MFS transporter, partial [Acidobacteria bacterium]|nr:MFS transporter [Acidobacteriota bacterium]